VNERLDEVAAVAHAAGALIATHYRAGPVEADTKADGTLVTAADVDADALIRARLPSVHTCPILSEEAAIAPWSERRKWSRFWLVDPLDGTRDFVRRTGDFCVCIGLIDEGEPVLGVVHAPMLDTTWMSVKDGPVIRWRGSERRTLPPAAPADPPRVALASRFHREGGGTDRYLQTLGIERVEKFGSAIKFGKMAESMADVYVRLGPTMEWDVGAGECIIRSAGLEIVVPGSGARIAYNKRELRNPSFIVRAPSSSPPPAPDAA
jgi:3'(2'), 5'-bisphosphate nucleotidase